MDKETAIKIRGKEICFLYYYFYPFLDKQFPDLNVANIRRVSMAIATLADCSAKAVEEMIQLRSISFKEKEDILWKTEHNIYPHRTTWHEKTYCMNHAECPKSHYRRKVFLGLATKTQQEKDFMSKEPEYRGERYYYGPVLHEEHWEAIEKIMIMMDKLLTTFPSCNWWNYNIFYEKENNNE